MAPPKKFVAKAQKEGESHIRYKQAVEKVISLAASEQEKASLAMMVVQEFLVERDESGTSLSLWQTTNGIRPWGFTHNDDAYKIYINPSKMSGRSKQLTVNIGRPPEQSDLADSMRAINVTFKLFASISKERLATIDAVAAKTILQDAGTVDERCRIKSVGEYGGPDRWHALRMRFQNEALNMESIRSQGERIISRQEPRGDLAQLLSGGIHQTERIYTEEIVATIEQPIRQYLFSSGSRTDLETSLNDCLHQCLGGNQQYVDLDLDLRCSPSLQRQFNRNSDILILQDGRGISELDGFFNKLHQLKALLPYVNLPTFMVHQYIRNLIDNDMKWNPDVEAQVLSRIVPLGGRIHRLKYGTSTNMLELKCTYSTTDIAAACSCDDKGFIYRYFYHTRRSLADKKKRSRNRT